MYTTRILNRVGPSRCMAAIRAALICCASPKLSSASALYDVGIARAVSERSPGGRRFGWAADSAIRYYGTYVGVLCSCPSPGDGPRIACWFTARGLFGRRADRARQALMLTPALLAPLATALTHVPLSRALIDAKIPLGLLHLAEGAEQKLLTALAVLEGASNAARHHNLMRSVYLLPATHSPSVSPVWRRQWTLETQHHGPCSAGCMRRTIQNGMRGLHFSISPSTWVLCSRLDRRHRCRVFRLGDGFGIASAVMAAGMITLFRLRARSMAPPRRRFASPPQRAQSTAAPAARVCRDSHALAAIFWAAFFKCMGCSRVLAYRNGGSQRVGFYGPRGLVLVDDPFFLDHPGSRVQAVLRALHRRGAAAEHRHGLRPTRTRGRRIFLPGGRAVAASARELAADRVAGSLLSDAVNGGAFLVSGGKRHGVAACRPGILRTSHGHLVHVLRGRQFLSGLAGGLVTRYPIAAVLAGIGTTLAVCAVLFFGLAPRISRLVQGTT